MPMVARSRHRKKSQAKPKKQEEDAVVENRFKPAPPEVLEERKKEDAKRILKKAKKLRNRRSSVANLPLIALVEEVSESKNDPDVPLDGLNITPDDPYVAPKRFGYPDIQEADLVEKSSGYEVPEPPNSGNHIGYDEGDFPKNEDGNKETLRETFINNNNNNDNNNNKNNNNEEETEGNLVREDFERDGLENTKQLRDAGVKEESEQQILPVRENKGRNMWAKVKVSSLVDAQKPKGRQGKLFMGFFHVEKKYPILLLGINLFPVQ